MKQFIHRRRWIVLGVAAVLAAGAGVGLAAGMIAKDSDVIQACAKQNSGALRIVETPGDCLASEVAVSWNASGPAGTPGPAGPPGPPGSRVSYSNGYSEHKAVPPGSFRFAEAICPSGTQVVGGGYATQNVSTALLVPTNSYPIGKGDGRGAWYVVMFNIGQQTEEFWAVSYCVTIT